MNLSFGEKTELFLQKFNELHSNWNRNRNLQNETIPITRDIMVSGVTDSKVPMPIPTSDLDHLNLFSFTHHKDTT